MSNQLQYKTLNFKAAAEGGLGENQFAGYGSTFLGVDSYGHIIAPGAFKGTLEFFKAEGMILWQHRDSVPIGKPLDAYEDSHGLFIKGQVSDTQQGRDCMTLMRDKVVRKMSIGYRTEGYEALSKERGIEVLGSEEAYETALRGLPWYIDELILLTQIKLYEVSPVTFPANTEADITQVKAIAGNIETERDFERFLRDAGFSRKMAAIVASGFKAALQRDSGEQNTAQAEDLSALAESIKSLTATLTGS